MKFVYIVRRHSPMGETMMGIYTSIRKAKKAALAWNKEHTCKWDEATVDKVDIKK